jgi:hypothetical protein
MEELGVGDAPNPFLSELLPAVAQIRDDLRQK